MSEHLLKLALRASKKDNEATLKECINRNEEFKKLRESLARRGIVDVMNPEQFPIGKPGFSWKKVEAKLTEADSSTSFQQVLRAGVQLAINSAYESTPVTYDEWTHTVASSRDTELYAPIQGITFPAEVGRQEAFPESTAAGLSIQLRNKKYGQVFAIEKELLEDDQTGQFSKQAALIGQYLKLVLEVLVYGKLASPSGGCSYAGLSVPKSETQPAEESTYPWSTSLVGGGSNRPASFGALSQSNIQNGIIALMKQKNKLGLYMGVSPDRILISPKYRFDIAVLLNSSYYPSGAAAAGNTGGAFAINPLQSVADVTVSRYMFDNSGVAVGDSKAWYIVDSGKPWFVVQLRESPSVVQENPMAGESFNRDIMRFKGVMRANADGLDFRFAWQGSDGSV